MMDNSRFPIAPVRIIAVAFIAGAVALAAGCGGEAAPPTPSEEIMAAARADDLAEVRRLLEADGALLNARDSEARTPLHHAASGGSAAVVEFLLEEGAEVSPRDKGGVTPLERAALTASQEVVAILMKAAGEGNGEDGLTGKAVERNREMLELLEEAGGR